jgi:ParB-like chromosome segregation protein Spo0J
VQTRILRVNPKSLAAQQSNEQISQSRVKRLTADMKARGYDESQPVTGARDERGRIMISDGHHRVKAAIRAGIAEVPVEVQEE